MNMQNKYFKNAVSKLVVLAFLAPSITLATAKTDALYDSRAELESADVNLEEAQGGYDTGAEELALAKDNHASETAKNVEAAARIRQEIARLQKEQTANSKEAKSLAAKAQSLSKLTVKLEAEEKKTQKAADAAASKLEKARIAFDHSQGRKNLSAQALSDVRAKHAQGQQALKAKTKEVVAAKNAEQKSAAALKNAQVQFKKYQAQGRQEMQRLNKQLQVSLAKTAQNDKKAESFRQKKQQMEATVQAKRQRLSDAKAKERNSLARVSSN
jgi:chromosome segregation ATPase